MKPQLLILFATLSLAASADTPAGWMVAGSAPKDYDFGAEAQNSDGGKSAYIKGKSSAAPTGFGTLMQMVSADEYRGGRWKLSARMRTDKAAKAQMWMRVDGPERAMYAFDNMDDRPVTGDTGWKRYEIVLDVPGDSVGVAFGFFLSGGGEVWADDFKLERVTDATPVTGKRPQQPRTPVNLDFER
jgi:hypothetical protein